MKKSKRFNRNCRFSIKFLLFLSWLLTTGYCLLFIISCEKFFDFSRPEVRFISPQNGETVYLSTQVEIEALDENLERVELYVDGNKIKIYENDQITNGRITDFLQISAGYHTLAAKAYDKGGNFSEAEINISVNDLAVPNLISPADGALFWYSENIGFSWSSVANATIYNIQIDDDSAFSSPIIDAQITSTSYSWTPGESYCGVFCWRVRAGGDGLWGPFSSLRTFESYPYEVGYYDTPGYAWGVYVSGSYAYVADLDAGLRIINVSNPSSPYEVGYYDTPGYAWGVYVSGSYAYVADSDAGLRIIKIKP